MVNTLIPFLLLLFFLVLFILSFYFMVKQNVTSKKNKRVIRERVFSKEMEEKYLNILLHDNKYLSVTKRRIIKLTVIIINLLIIVIVYFYLNKQIWIIFVCFLISALFLYKLDSNYKGYFKDNLIHKIISEYDANLKYYPIYGISKDEYKNCRFQEYFDYYHSEDLIINVKTGFQFADIILKREYTDSEGHTHTDVVYCGSLARLPIKNIHCNIYLGNTTCNIFGENNFAELDFENDEFNKMFGALSDNELQAYKILTPDVMEKFVELKKNFFTDLDIRLLNDCLYMRFLSGNGFVPSLTSIKKEQDSIITSLAVLHEVIDVMGKVKDIIENKNLD